MEIAFWDVLLHIKEYETLCATRSTPFAVLFPGRYDGAGDFPLRTASSHRQMLVTVSGAVCYLFY